MKEITIPAPAKINLALDIKGVREDGYHQLEMIMQSISLHDIITLKKKEMGINLTVSEDSLPDNEENIAYKAADLILKRYNINGGVDIHIEKNIPIAGGMAGGSTDAAAVLNGITRLYGISVSRKELIDLAGKIGSDVPFCLRGGTVYAYGRGEKIEQLTDITEQHLVIVNPGIQISTPWAYHRYDMHKVVKTVPVKKLVNIIGKHQKINWSEGWGNTLEEVVIPSYPEIQEIKSILKEMGAIFTLMSGSGSSVFAIVPGESEGQDIVKNWPRDNDFITTSKTVKEDFPELWRKY